jgi:hypothetical protein
MVVDRRPLVPRSLHRADRLRCRAVFAASPAVAERIGLDTYHFVKRHALFLVPALL